MKCRTDSQIPFWPERKYKREWEGEKHNKVTEVSFDSNKLKSKESRTCTKRMQQLVIIKTGNVRKVKI